ncbi:type II secretion system protein [bacterium]|nr:type II secretion system protein [bacterium]
MKKLIGFTLSEVLITLVIIGVIAAITVPNIIANSNEQAIRSALKKNYSIISQALDRYYVDNGEHFKSVDYEEVHSFLTKYLNVSKDCYAKGDCDDKNIDYKTYQDNSKSGWIKFPAGKSVILTDGTYITYDWTSNGSPVFTIDVNGPFKNPNKLGVDTFALSIKEQYNLAPHFEYFDLVCSKKSNYIANGLGCTAKVLQEGKISY